MDKIKGIKGMPDILPNQISVWQNIENILRHLMIQYQYKEIRNPILESTLLFKNSIGENTDIIEKEMYFLYDKKGHSFNLRPEGTASCVRACIEHTLLRKQQKQRLWYMGPMYRYEQPQKGRYRQFYQFGVEAFNFENASIDAEQIALATRLWKELNIDGIVQLEINSLGNVFSRNKYKDILIKYFKNNQEQLDIHSKRRLYTNPLRILDSKESKMKNLIETAPKLLDYIDYDSRKHFDDLQNHLTTLNIPFKVNNKIVRGLDYYNRTVYEWRSDKLGAQSAVCSGGRFDKLVESLGGLPTPAVGFAIGLERLLLIIEQNKFKNNLLQKAHLICIGNNAKQHICIIAEKLRDQLKNIGIQTHIGNDNIGKLIKKANIDEADYAFIVGDHELETDSITVKFLRQEHLQKTIKIKNISKEI